ncbi:hypothetical protein [Actinosynnema sp. NPDC020468]|uniref:hypothetical protein n=1 Tax=Actinosynnema sp. NPDC020468 TaxID=3154488 RepID=UPI0033FD320C
MPHRTTLATVTAVVLATALAAPANAGTITAVDLGTLPGDTTSIATGINDAGTIVGHSYRHDGTTGKSFGTAVKWNAAGVITRLPVPRADPESTVFALNDAGTIIGDSIDAAGKRHALRWDPSGAVTPLAPLPGDVGTGAHHLTADGTVYGTSSSEHNNQRAVRWSRNGTPTQLENPFGAGLYSYITAVDGANVLGYVTNAQGVITFVRWDANGRSTPLLSTYLYPKQVNASGVIAGWGDGFRGVLLKPGGTPIDVGASQSPTGINSAGRVIADQQPNWPLATPVTWSPDGVLTALPLLPGNLNGSTADINDAGVIVGASTTWTGPHTPVSRAVRWNPDLSVVVLEGPPGRTEATANALNEKGAIVGAAYGDGANHAVLWRG